MIGRKRSGDKWGKETDGQTDDRQANTAVRYTESSTLRGREEGEDRGAGGVWTRQHGDGQVSPCMRTALEAKVPNALRDCVIEQE